MPSLWERQQHAYPVSEPPRTADVVVIGGGLTGVLTALLLAESGRDAVVVERDKLGAGASGRNAGLLLPGTSEPYYALETRWGQQRARELWAAMERGAALLLGIAAAHEVAFEWRTDGALHVAATEEEAADLAKAVVLLNRDGFDAAWVEAPELARWIGAEVPLRNGLASLAGALFQPHGGPLHSGLLVSGLAAAAARIGVRFVLDTPVTSASEDAHGASVVTRRGRISTDAVVVATNAWNASAADYRLLDLEEPRPGRGGAGRGRTEAGGPGEAGGRGGETGAGDENDGPSPYRENPPLVPTLADLMTPVRGQVLSSAPLPPRFRGAWSLNRGYEYLQQLPDGRIVLGGMRWVDPRMEIGVWGHRLNDAIQSRLTSWLEAVAPPAKGPLVEERWSGLMAWTRDRLPLIGAMPEAERIWFAGGYSGHGLPAAGLAAEILTARINAEPPPDNWSLFDPGHPDRGEPPHSGGGTGG